MKTNKKKLKEASGDLGELRMAVRQLLDELYLEKDHTESVLKLEREIEIPKSHWTRKS
jgi:hypothetical protein